MKWFIQIAWDRWCTMLKEPVTWDHILWAAFAGLVFKYIFGWQI